jgi:hypothetical protein
VNEFDALNQGHKGEFLTVEPGMIEQMEEEFDRWAAGAGEEGLRPRLLASHLQGAGLLF